MAARLLATTVLAIAAAASLCLAGEPLVVEVRETAGIQRFVYPVSANFDWPGATADFQLSDGDRPIAAQFTQLGKDESNAGWRWSVDFNVDLLPGETRRLTLGVPAKNAFPARSRPGLEIKNTPGKIRVVHPALEFTVADDLRGLIESIRVRGDDYLKPGGAGLVMRLRDGGEIPLPGPAGSGEMSAPRIVKSGPLAVALDYSGDATLPDGKSVSSSVRLDFPLGKSCVKVEWNVNDPADLVASIGAELRLRLEPEANGPILADVGAAGWTYYALRSQERLVFRVRSRSTESDAREPAWAVDRIVGGRTVPYARPPVGAPDVPPQGWAHLLDAKRATAIAIEGFAGHTNDSIELGEDGHMSLRREFAKGDGGLPSQGKRLAFWLHVVSSPPQLGAATSPQSMLMPPAVRVIPAAAE